MDEALWLLLGQHWPELLLANVFLFGVVMFARFLALTFDSCYRMLGPLGRYWRNRRSISQAESDDMRRQIIALDKRVRALLYRDECYFAYTLYDQEYHHRQQLKAAACGCDLEPHVPFLLFRDKWVRERGLEQELEIWI